MTLDKLAAMTQRELRVIRRNSATREDLKQFATREDLRDFKDDVIDTVRTENLKVLESNDKVMGKLDHLLTEDMAHSGVHKETGDKLADHESRLKRLEHAKR